MATMVVREESDDDAEDEPPGPGKPMKAARVDFASAGNDDDEE